jgi:hypothetical protein
VKPYDQNVAVIGSLLGGHPGLFYIAVKEIDTKTHSYARLVNYESRTGIVILNLNTYNARNEHLKDQVQLIT